jgi:hypothetical protein
MRTWSLAGIRCDQIAVGTKGLILSIAVSPPPVGVADAGADEVACGRVAAGRAARDRQW